MSVMPGVVISVILGILCDIIAGAMCAQHIRRNVVSADIVGGRTSGHWTGVSSNSAGQCSDNADRPINVSHLQQWTSQRR